VIQLPRGSFQRTDAQAYIAVLTKNSNATKKIRLLAASTDGRLSKPIFVDRANARQRLDFVFNSTTSSVKSNRRFTTLEQIGASVVRGVLSSKEARETNLPYFHTSHFPLSDTVRLNSGRIAHCGHVAAAVGDLLVARVHRNLEEKVCLVVAGQAVLTDCVFRVRIPSRFRDAVAEYLTSNKGRAALAASSRGTGARMLSKSDLLALPLEI
jgi:type I restriction enzyme M protein